MAQNRSIAAVLEVPCRAPSPAPDCPELSLTAKTQDMMRLKSTAGIIGSPFSQVAVVLKTPLEFLLIAYLLQTTLIIRGRASRDTRFRASARNTQQARRYGRDCSHGGYCDRNPNNLRRSSHWLPLRSSAIHNPGIRCLN